MAPARPRIDRVVVPGIHPGADEFLTEGRTLRSAPPGAAIMIVGRGFGTDPERVAISIGSDSSPPFPGPLFARSRLITAVPLIPAGDTSITVRVSGVAGRPFPFKIARMRVPRREPGSITRRFVAGLEALIVVGSAEQKIANLGTSIPNAFRRRLEGELEAARIVLLRLREALGELDDETLARLDLEIDESRALVTIEAGLEMLRAGGESTAGIALELYKKLLTGLTEVLEGLGELFELALLKGTAKILKGVLGTIAEIMAQRIQAADHEEQEQEKERQEREFRDKVESKLDREESKLDELRGAVDHEEGKLDVQELKLDFIKTLIDRQEGKHDLELQEIDKLESKSDRQEGKLDKVEAKLDHLEGKVDKVEVKEDRLEGKVDRLEPKLDKLEPKIDKLEPKIDKLEPKIDKLEPKIDKLEPKIDQMQSQLDRGKEFWQFDPSTWRVRAAESAGVRMSAASAGAGVATIPAFSVESIQLLDGGVSVAAIIVDGLRTDLSPLHIVGPANVLIQASIAPVGASHSVLLEFDQPYSGRLEYSGEKPQGLDMCTVVTGPGSSQRSPNPCR